jgi:hypothetical protein
MIAATFFFAHFSSGHAQTVPTERRENRNAVFVPAQRQVPRWLAETVVRAAQATNVDPGTIMALADKVSGLFPNRKAQAASAEGLFQFVEGTWLDLLRRYGLKHGYRTEARAIRIIRGRPVVANSTVRKRILSLRRDPYLSALMAGEMITTHRQILAGKVVRDPAFAELYVAYVLGLNGASCLMDLLGDTPGPSEGVSARRQGPRISSRVANE